MVGCGRGYHLPVHSPIKECRESLRKVQCHVYSLEEVLRRVLYLSKLPRGSSVLDVVFDVCTDREA